VHEKQEPDARPEHPAQFAQRPRLVVHPAQHQRGDHGIERAVLERQILGRSAYQCAAGSLVADLALQVAHIGEFRVEPGCAIVLAALYLGPAAALVSERSIKAGLWPGPWAAWT
jgi:hypothetical protein